MKKGTIDGSAFKMLLKMLYLKVVLFDKHNLSWGEGVIFDKITTKCSLINKYFSRFKKTNKKIYE